LGKTEVTRNPPVGVIGLEFLGRGESQEDGDRIVLAGIAIDDDRPWNGAQITHASKRASMSPGVGIEAWAP
jgi:hypothetical protein